MGLPSRTPAVTQRDPVPDSKDLGRPLTSFSRRGQTRGTDSRKQVRFSENVCLCLLSSSGCYVILCQAQVRTEYVYIYFHIHLFLISYKTTKLREHLSPLCIFNIWLTYDIIYFHTVINSVGGNALQITRVT